ncbi:MAG: hypothetical protein EXS14_07540 [Planctomycetes bacterium]|nr:hypothetical protein [Planctomycetota bacterium]
MRRNREILVPRLLLMILLAACACTGCIVNPNDYVPQPSPEEVARVQRDIVPLIRSVPGADRALLWTATRGYMDRIFVPEAIRLRDETKQVMETHLLETVDNGQSARTVVTVQVGDDPAMPGAARLGVIAQRIDARMDFGAALDQRPVPTAWILIGNDDVVAGAIADAILQRYLLLRSGRDPDVELPAPHRIGVLPSGGAPTGTLPQGG